MASWNPAPTIGGASWYGNPVLATKNQLLSSIDGLYADLADFTFSTISSVGTLTATQWISTPLLYVSDIVGAQIDISGVIINKDGVFNAPIVSLSSMSMKGFDNLLDVDVSFDFGLGQAIGGVVGGLGALVGGGLIAVGTGAGLAIQGAEQGIATMVAGRPQNFISQTQYETINFTSQLQISTLGNANPAYSSIFRTVSSISANQVPGKEVFISTIFYPGQICIRSASDPFNLITGDSNLNTSTIQSFGQWVPMQGLEPENIIANSVSTNFLSTGELYASLGGIETFASYNSQINTLGVPGSASFAYQAPLTFQTGATNYGSLIGDLNRLYMETTNGFIFSKYPTLTESASLYVGNANESILNVSTINSLGSIKTVNFFASTITAETLIVNSTVTVENIVQTETNVTSTLIADEAYINAGFLSSLSTFYFATGVGNSNGPYDINKNFSWTSTTYDSISSLTNNILNYQLNIATQDEAVFNLGGQGSGTPAVRYNVAPTNVEQWGSTILYCNPNNGNAATIFMSPIPDWSGGVVPSGTFDLTIDQTKNGFFYAVSQASNAQGSYISTFIKGSPNFGACNTYRFTLPPTNGGWWDYVTPAPPPYETVNNNTLTISQDINDVYIKTTDRLNIQAGDIFLQGNTHIADVTFSNLTLNNLTTNFLSSLSTAAFGDDTYFNTNIWVDNAVVGSSGDFSSITTTIGEVNYAQWQAFWTSNYAPQSMLSSYTTAFSTTLLQSFFSLEKTRPVIAFTPGTNNTMSLQKLGSWTLNSGLQTTNYAFGTFKISPIDNTFKIYTDNNGFGSSDSYQVVNLSNTSATNTMYLYINFPSSAIPIGPSSAASIYWNGSTGLFSQITYADWTPETSFTEFDILQNINTVTLVSPSTIVSGNLSLTGSLSLQGPTITTFIMTWSHQIGIASQHDYGTQAITDGNGTSYNYKDWVMKYSVVQINLDNSAYAMNAYSMRPNTDVNGNYTFSWDTWYTTVMATNFDIQYWVDITMYPRSMINPVPNKNW